MMKTLKIKRWFILFGLCMVSFLENGTQRSFAIILNDLTAEFETTTAYFGALFGAMFGCFFIFAFLTIPLLRYFSLRQLTIVGGLLSTTSIILCSFAVTAAQFSAALSLFGLGYLLIISPTNSCTTSYFPDRYALAYGIQLCGGSIGLILGPMLFEIFVINYGWRGALLVLAGINAHMVVTGALLEPLPSRTADGPKEASQNRQGSDNTGFDHSDVEGDFNAVQINSNTQTNCVPFPSCPDACGESDSLKLPNEHPQIKLHSEVDKGNGSVPTFDDECELQSTGFTYLHADEVNLPQISPKLDTDSKVLEPAIERIDNLPNLLQADEDITDVQEEVQRRRGCVQFLLAPVRFFELNIFKEHPLQIVVCIQAFFYGMSYSGWIIFLIPNAIAKGLSVNLAVKVSIVGGACNILGRLGAGAIGSRDNFKLELFYYIINMICASAYFANYIAESYWFLMTLSIINGIMQGAKTHMQIVLAVNAVGKERCSTSMSLLFVCKGISYPLCGVLFGALYDVTRSYNVPFCVSGLFDILVAHVVIAPKLISFCTRRHQSSSSVSDEDSEKAK